MQLEPFCGSWRLDPAACQYEVGQPPGQGVYRIEWDGQALIFTAEWVAADGKELSVQYRSVPDGRPHPFVENPAVADALITVVTDGPSLDTTTIKDGRRIAFAQRLLSPDGQSMTVTQSGTTPQGTPFSNVSLYRKV